MDDFMKTMLRLDYVDCFVNIAEIKVKLLNMTDEQVIDKAQQSIISCNTGPEVNDVIAEFMSLGKLSDESRLILHYFIMNDETFTALCADKIEEVAVFV